MVLARDGAGKSTLVECLVGMQQPDKIDTQDGGALIYGHTLNRDMSAIRSSLGVCLAYDPLKPLLIDTFTPREQIIFFSQLKGSTFIAAEQEAIALCKLFRLEDKDTGLSMGRPLTPSQLRKLAIAMALCGTSKFIVLDEPTRGMDAIEVQEMWDVLTALKSGRTILLTTTDANVADTFGDRVGVLHDGQIICCGPPRSLKAEYGLPGYKLVVQAPWVPELTSHDIAVAMWINHGFGSVWSWMSAQVFYLSICLSVCLMYVYLSVLIFVTVFIPKLYPLKRHNMKWPHSTTAQCSFSHCVTLPFSLKRHNMKWRHSTTAQCSSRSLTS